MAFDDFYISILYDLAKEASDNGEIPVGCLIFDSSNKLIGKGLNNRQGSYSVLGHAEINCILDAESSLKDWRLDGCYMLVSLEPCDLCSLVIEKSRLSKVYFILPSKAVDFDDRFFINKEQVIVSDEVYDSFRNLLTSFFDSRR